MNKIKCLKCGDEIESKYRHDFKYCKCGAVAIDGGNDYQRICGEFKDFEVWRDGKYEPMVRKNLTSKIYALISKPIQYFSKLLKRVTK